MVDPHNLNKEPEIPSINQICWSISMDQKYGKEIKSFVKSLSKRNYKFTEFKTEFFKKFDKKNWDKDMMDVIYALDILGLVNVKENGIIGRNPINKILDIEIN